MVAVLDYPGRAEFDLMNKPWSGARLKDIREQAGLKQFELADMLTAMRATDEIDRSSVHPAMLSQWESGKRTPDADDIYDICMTLHCNCMDLYKPVGTVVRWHGGKPRKPAPPADETVD